MKKVIALLLCCGMLLLSLSACQSEVGATPEGETASAGETVQIVRAIKDVKKGEKLAMRHIELVEVSGVTSTENLFTSIDDVSMKFAAEDLYAGDIIFKSQITDKAQNIITDGGVLRQEIKGPCGSDYVVVSDYIKPNTGEDVYKHIQNLIISNPGRTIYFPDGEYIISAPLTTLSEGTKSTTFVLSDNAVIKASDNWSKANSGKHALIVIGQLNSDGSHVNDSRSNGSYFGVWGGTLDGNDMANGIQILSSRETFIHGVRIKNALTGIKIEKGANGAGSSDADIENVEIVGNGKGGTIGIEIIGYDNTISNVKIYNMEKGVLAHTGGHAYRSVEIYFSEDYKNYHNTIGIYSPQGAFFYDCYVENAATAYKFENSRQLVIDGLRARWTYAMPIQIAFHFGNNATYMSQCRADFFPSSGDRIFLRASNGGKVLDSPIFDTTLENGGLYKSCLLSSGMIDLSKIK